jgi:hypothetical protein
MSIRLIPIDQLAELRRAAFDYVQRATGCPLDGSEESLAFVDHYLDRLRKDPPEHTEALRLVAYALGVYLGDLAISRFGGRWLALPLSDEGEPQDPALSPLSWRVDLDAVPLRFDPIGMAAAALSQLRPAQAPDEAEDDGISLRAGARGLQSALQEALAHAAPVTDEYYYSFTGRFETLSHIVDLVLDIQARRAQAEAQAEDETAGSLLN